MLNIEEINKEINELENSGHTSYAVCEKLANLYIVRDHLIESRQSTMGFVGNVRVSDPGMDAETMRMAQRMNREDLEREYARHMGEVRDKHPMEYEREMNRMRRDYNNRY